MGLFLSGLIGGKPTQKDHLLRTGIFSSPPFNKSPRQRKDTSIQEIETRVTLVENTAKSC